MTDATSQPSLGLQDMPDDVINLIVGYLRAIDRKRLMATCRRAAWAALKAAEPKLRITSRTRFTGIKNVLDSYPTAMQLEIICPDTHLGRWDPLSAVNVLMGTRYSKQVISDCCWEAITKVTIQGNMLECLVPQSMILAFPKMAELTIRQLRPGSFQDQPVFATVPAYAKPMIQCTTLKQLKFDVCIQQRSLLPQHQTSLQLPAAYHSAAELRNNLPNIDTLTFNNAPYAPNGVLIDTFATQLTRLEIGGDSSKVADSVRLCSKLQHLRINNVMLPDNRSSLRVLDLIHTLVNDGNIKLLLQLPSLTTVRLGSLYINKDWSGQACSWQELHIREHVSFSSLANLNFNHLRKLSMGPSTVIMLPYSATGGLSVVQRAVDNLAGVGQIVWEAANTTAPANTSVQWQFAEHFHHQAVESEQDEAVAELLTVASQRVGPVKTCKLCHWFLRPRTIAAIIDWGHTFIESVCLFNEEYPPTFIWQALKPLRALKTFTMGVPAAYEPSSVNGHTHRLNGIVGTVSCAAMDYVIPTKRSLCLKFGVKHSYNSKHAVKALNLLNVNTDTSKTVLLNDAQGYLEELIPHKLPANSRLASVEKVINDPFDHDCIRHGWHFFWSIVIEPCQEPETS